MNMHVNITDVMTIVMDDDGMIQIPRAILNKLGIVPGHPVMLGYNDDNEVVIFQETPEERSTRIDQAIKELAETYSTGQTTEDYMEMMRGPHEDDL